MPKKKKTRSPGANVKRPSFPGTEEKNSWLKLLLDGYHIVDRGVAVAIEREKKRGRKLACTKGCSHCCATHKDIPIYPLELKGIIWYVTERVTGSERERLKKQLVNFKKDRPCPFLVDGICSIHPLRPMACRQFNVFEEPCAEGEDPYYTRRQDVMDPVKKHVDQAFFVMLPFHGVEKDSERIKFVESGEMHRMVRELHSCNWKALAEKMERHDKERRTSNDARRMTDKP